MATTWGRAAATRRRSPRRGGPWSSRPSIYVARRRPRRTALLCAPLRRRAPKRRARSSTWTRRSSARHSGLGSAYEALGRFEEAVGAFERAGSVTPENVVLAPPCAVARRSSGLLARDARIIEPRPGSAPPAASRRSTRSSASATRRSPSWSAPTSRAMARSSISGAFPIRPDPRRSPLRRPGSPGRDSGELD